MFTAALGLSDMSLLFHHIFAAAKSSPAPPPLGEAGATLTRPSSLTISRSSSHLNRLNRKPDIFSQEKYFPPAKGAAAEWPKSEHDTSRIWQANSIRRLRINCILAGGEVFKCKCQLILAGNTKLPGGTQYAASHL